MEGVDVDSLEAAHDAPRTRPSLSSEARRGDPRRDLHSPAPRSDDPTEAVQEAQAPRTTEEILTERGKTHGDFADHAMITQFLKRIMRTGKNWEALSDIQKESLEMNAHKIGRILSGNPNHQDHWDDIAGYAKLISQRL